MIYKSLCSYGFKIFFRAYHQIIELLRFENTSVHWKRKVVVVTMTQLHCTDVVHLFGFNMVIKSDNLTKILANILVLYLFHFKVAAWITLCAVVFEYSTCCVDAWIVLQG